MPRAFAAPPSWRSSAIPEPEIYDLVADPAETRNLYASERDTFRRLWRQLELLRAGFPDDDERTGKQTANAETTARLQSLGYLSGSPAPQLSPGADPKNRLETWHQIQAAMAAFGARSFELTATILEQVLESERDIPVLYEYFGASYMRLERWQRAEAIYREALGRGLESIRALIDLGIIHRRRSELGRAEDAFKAAIALDPSSVEAFHQLGDLVRSAGRGAEAADHYRRALEINPDYVYSWNGLGMTLARAGRNDEVLLAFRRAVGVDPDEPFAQFNLAVQLERMGRGPQAVAIYERFLAFSAGRSDLNTQRQRAAEAVSRLGGTPADPSHQG